jgi:hypothetical protein
MSLIATMEQFERLWALPEVTMTEVQPRVEWYTLKCQIGICQRSLLRLPPLSILLPSLSRRACPPAQAALIPQIHEPL